MSLINKMLQDLDARGGDGTRADASSLVRPVSHGARGGWSPAAIGAGVLALAVVGGAGFAGWKYFMAGKHPVAAPVAARAPQPAPVQQAVQQNGPVAAATADEGPPVVQGDISPEEHRAAGEKLARKMEERNAAARRAAAAPPQREPVPQAATGEAPGHGAGADGKLRQKEGAARARAAELRRLQQAAKSKAAPGVAAPAALVAPEGGEAGLSSQQKAENEYRRALLKLQDARVSEAIAGLEQAVFLYPRHEAARQTLVGLLVEGGRTNDAIRHLMLGVGLDPRQVNMAMLLARLQLENGGNALETLQRSLPYAESNADYRAMMAGVLQRTGHHKEAIEHYLAAVRLQPANGVWWMGMGISLQAEKRNAEAKAAFLRAKDSGRLSPELQTFVERRLQQLD